MSFVAKLIAQDMKIDALVNNAAVMFDKLKTQEFLDAERVQQTF